MAASQKFQSLSSIIKSKTEKVSFDKRRREATIELDQSRLKHTVTNKLSWDWFVYLRNAFGNYWNGSKVKGTQYLEGDKGNDTLIAGLGNDELYGKGGHDVLYGKVGNDLMYGGKGNDTLYGDAGNDRLYGENGNDVLYSGSGNDTLYGDDGNDLISIDSGRNTAYGGFGSDTLLGGKGNDALHGDHDNDILDGGLGRDTLEGGSGRDVFRFSTALSSKNVDTIYDLEKEDTIQLSRKIFTKLKSGPLSANYFVGSSKGRAIHRDDYIIYNTATGSLMYDQDGSGGEAPIEFARIASSQTVRVSQIVIVD